MYNGGLKQFSIPSILWKLKEEVIQIASDDTSRSTQSSVQLNKAWIPPRNTQPFFKGKFKTEGLRANKTSAVK